MLIYLDTCSLQRPLDDQSQPRVRLEAEAVLVLLKLLDLGAIELVGSEVLLFESERNPHPSRRRFALQVLERTRNTVEAGDQVVVRARELTGEGFAPLDALHLASAEQSGAECFCTCDDLLLKRAATTGAVKLRVVSPIDLVVEIDR